MALSRRLRGEPTELEEEELVLRMSMLEGMLPVERDSKSGEDLAVTQGLADDAAVAPDAEFPRRGHKRKQREDTSSYKNAAA